MALKSHRPTSPARRFKIAVDFSDVTKSKPEKKLTRPKKRTGGRNSYGRITSRFRGGGHKKAYRIIDFKRDKIGIPAKVIAIEYDPNRTSRLALLSYADGEKRYIICPVGLGVGQTVLSGPTAPITPGNTLPLQDIPVGEMLHNIELKPGKGGAMVRSAGTGAQLMAKDGDYALLRMPSGEQRKVLIRCQATIGMVGNTDHANKSIGKAGSMRWRGRRPHNRGVTMNPVDHPHGGGEGKTSGGRHPVSPWGQLAKGYKTRTNKRTSKFIVRRRRG